MKRYTWLIILFSLYGMAAWGNEFAGEGDSITSRFMEQLRLFPQEKIYVHTDKSGYAAGDTIWLRAHLVDAATHVPASVSRYVYVELANEKDSIFNRIKIRANDSIYRGHIALEPLIPQGYYTLRAYTKFMENLDGDYLFKSSISIKNPISVSSSKDEKTPALASSEEPPFNVTFFPEGGYLPANVPWRIAFKAIAKDGWHENISGTIVDKETDELVATLPTSYLGMGYVTIVPQEGRRYTALCTDSQNRLLQFDLPEVTPKAQVLTATWRKKNLMISLSQPVVRPLHIVMQTRGLVFYSELWKPLQKILTIDAEALPAGVVQILLLDENEHPISERLVFSKNLDDTSLQLTTDKPIYGMREPVKAELALTDSDQQPLQGDISISITDDNTVSTDYTTSILSYLLLTSELKGTVEFPEAYFDAAQSKADWNLDILMMTQGWRRYDIAKILKEEYEQPSVPLEIDQEISGTIMSEFNSKPKIDSPITLLALEHMFSDETRSDSLGNFRFTRFEFPENTNFVVRGTTKKGNAHDVLLSLDKEKFIPFAPSKSVADLYNRKSVTEEYNINVLDSSGVKLIELDEVVIKAKQIEKKGKSMYHSALANVYDSEDFMLPRPNTMSDLLARLPGVMVTGFGVSIRGNKPLILVDDMEFEYDMVADMQPDDIEEVELMKDASAAIFGSRGAGGAILITTKSGEFNRAVKNVNIAPIRPLGYQIPAEFYSPKYVVNTGSIFKTRDKRTTLYWNPCIRLSNEGKAQFEFYTADQQGSYTVIMQGVTPDGKIIFKKEQINKP